jgi:hypothetical protein
MSAAIAQAATIHSRQRPKVSIKVGVQPPAAPPTVVMACAVIKQAKKNTNAAHFRRSAIIIKSGMRAAGGATNINLGIGAWSWAGTRLSGSGQQCSIIKQARKSTNALYYRQHRRIVINAIPATPAAPEEGVLFRFLPVQAPSRYFRGKVTINRVTVPLTTAISTGIGHWTWAGTLASLQTPLPIPQPFIRQAVHTAAAIRYRQRPKIRIKSKIPTLPLAISMGIGAWNWRGLTMFPVPPTSFSLKVGHWSWVGLHLKVKKFHGPGHPNVFFYSDRRFTEGRDE